MIGLVACDPGSDDAQEPEEPTTEPATRDETSDEPTDDDTGATEEPTGPQPLEHPEPGENFEENTQAGAEDAAVYFVELFDYVNSSGDFEAWDALATEECNFCTGSREEAEETFRQGGWVITQPPRIEDVAATLTDDERGDYYVEVTAAVAQAVVYDSDGQVVKTYPEAITVMRMILDWSGSWQIAGLDAEDL